MEAGAIFRLGQASSLVMGVASNATVWICALPGLRSETWGTQLPGTTHETVR
jgi:hypothetical protein